MMNEKLELINKTLGDWDNALVSFGGYTSSDKCFYLSLKLMDELKSIGLKLEQCTWIKGNVSWDDACIRLKVNDAKYSKHSYVLFDKNNDFQICFLGRLFIGGELVMNELRQD